MGRVKSVRVFVHIYSHDKMLDPQMSPVTTVFPWSSFRVDLSRCIFSGSVHLPVCQPRLTLKTSASQTAIGNQAKGLK